MTVTSRKDASPSEHWRPTSNSLLNALTIGLLAFQIPRDPWGDDAYLTVATLGFVALATLNHLDPRRLAWLTHGVKAAYTHVLFASLAPPGSRGWLAAALVVSTIDLLPVFLRSAGARSLCEAFGAAVRWSLIGMGFGRMGFPGPLLLIFGLCTAIYAWERRRRIAEGRRFDYGTLHCFEHLAVWGYLLALNAERLDLRWVWQSTLLALAVLAGALVVLGVGTNLQILRTARASLPPWFDPRLRSLILAKTRNNARSLRLQHYICKPFTTTILVTRVRWADIETMLDQIELNEHFDAVVGVLSGGAFITRYFARQRGIEQVHYVRSRLWSQLPLWRNIAVIARYYLGAQNEAKVSFLGEAPNLEGKRILVIDDAVCTGVTMDAVRTRCLERGAAHVATLTLFCNANHPTDYAAQISHCPMVWPWGWESD